jgi:hypothetical protein
VLLPCQGSHVTVHHDAISPAGQVLGVVPALLLDALGLDHALAMGRRRVGIAAVGADHAVDHQLQRARRLVPVGRRQDDHGVGRHPALVDLGHPVVGLVQRVVRVAGARPMAQRHRARHTMPASASSINDISAGRRGGLRSHQGQGGRTLLQLRNEARQRGLKGRSAMNKAELEAALTPSR